MEDTLRDNYYCLLVTLGCLNPCFNGRYSQSLETWVKKEDTAVLILVLMEDTLRDAMNNFSVTGYSLNPCFNGRYSQSSRHSSFAKKITES